MPEPSTKSPKAYQFMFVLYPESQQPAIDYIQANVQDENEAAAGRKGHCSSSEGTELDALVQMQQATASS